MTNAESLVLRGNRWPYGAHDAGTQERLLAWANARRLVLSGSRSCLHWLSKGRCNHNGHFDPDDECREGPRSRRWMDHVTAWTGPSKQRLLLCQPYNLFADYLADMAEVAKVWSLDIVVSSTGWYGNGTIAIELTPRGQRMRN